MGGSRLSFPRVNGADICGTVVAVGQNGDATLIGQRMIADDWLREWDGDPSGYADVGYYGSERDGGFAEYATHDRRNVVAIDSELSDAELATFSCSWTTAEAMLAKAGVGPSDTVLVTGASGGVGSALLQLAKRRGAAVVGMVGEAKDAALAVCGADVLLDRAPDDLSAALKNVIATRS